MGCQVNQGIATLADGCTNTLFLKLGTLTSAIMLTAPGTSKVCGSIITCDSLNPRGRNCVNLSDSTDRRVIYLISQGTRPQLTEDPWSLRLHLLRLGTTYVLSLHFCMLYALCYTADNTIDVRTHVRFFPLHVTSNRRLGVPLQFHGFPNHRYLTGRSTCRAPISIGWMLTRMYNGMDNKVITLLRRSDRGPTRIHMAAKYTKTFAILHARLHTNTTRGAGLTRCLKYNCAPMESLSPAFQVASNPLLPLQ